MKRVFIMLCSTVFLLGLAGKVNATLIELTPVADRTAIRQPESNVWVPLGDTEDILRVAYFENEPEYRTVLVFDITDVLGLPITQVTLSLFKVEAMDESIDVFAFTGDGEIQPTDFDPWAECYMGQFDPEGGLNQFNLGLRHVEDPYYDSLECFQTIAGLTVASNPYISILLSEAGTSSNEFLSSEANLSTYPDPDAIFPTLGIEVVPIPEPATVLLLGTGLVGLVGFRKKFKK